MVMVDNEELTTDSRDDLNRVLFEPPACVFRVIGDSLFHRNDLFHPDRAL